MTFVLQEKYGFKFDGLRRYITNRGLRIYPPYFFTLLISLVIINSIPEAAKSVNSALSLPTTPKEWAHNIIIFGINGENKRLIPPAWSVDVEIFFYGAMGALLSRNERICSVWLIFSLIATAAMVATDQSFNNRYMSNIGASLPFSIGAFTYFKKKELSKFSGKHIPVSIILFFLYVAFSGSIWEKPRNMGFYPALMLGLYVQLSLMNIDKKKVPQSITSIDNYLGDLSYPIFLCHWHVAAIITWRFIPEKGFSLFIFGAILSIFCAIIINQIAEKPFELIRDKLRNSI